MVERLRPRRDQGGRLRATGKACGRTERQRRRAHQGSISSRWAALCLSAANSRVGRTRPPKSSSREARLAGDARPRASPPRGFGTDLPLSRPSSSTLAKHLARGATDLQSGAGTRFRPAPLRHGLLASAPRPYLAMCRLASRRCRPAQRLNSRKRRPRRSTCEHAPTIADTRYHIKAHARNGPRRCRGDARERPTSC